MPTAYIHAYVHNIIYLYVHVYTICMYIDIYTCAYLNAVPARRAGRARIDSDSPHTLLYLHICTFTHLTHLTVILIFLNNIM